MKLALIALLTGGLAAPALAQGQPVPTVADLQAVSPALAR
jgi:hypothetical protein